MHREFELISGELGILAVTTDSEVLLSSPHRATPAEAMTFNTSSYILGSRGAEWTWVLHKFTWSVGADPQPSPLNLVSAFLPTKLPTPHSRHSKGQAFYTSGYTEPKSPGSSTLLFNWSIVD